MGWLDDLAKIIGGSATGEQAVKHPEAAATVGAPVTLGATGGAAAVVNGGVGGGGATMPGGAMAPRQITSSSLIDANNSNAIKTNEQLIAQLMGQTQNVQAAREYASQLDRGAINEQKALGYGTALGLGQNTNLGFANAAGANQQGQNWLGALGGYYANAPLATYNPIAADPYGLGLQNQALGNFQGMMNGSMDITAAQVARAAQAQAAMYYSNPQDIARQQQSYDQLQGIASGSLDWQSQGAQAYADPRTIQGQWDVLGQLQGAAGGSLDQESQAAQARVSDATLQQQQQGMDKLWGLTDPSITASERFMMETARREREQSDRASRGAVMADLSSRGFSGSGAQMTDMLGAQERSGQMNTLADLGAQANAQNRSTAALGMYVDASGKIRSQEFDEAFSRAAAGDAMAVNNANRRLQAMGMSADQLNNMRNASFDEAYKRGLAADAASAANQSTRLSGAGMAASQSNAIRQANDMVGMGNADRQTSVNMFNAGETNRVNMFNVGEQNRVGISNQDIRARGATAFGDEANQIRNSNDAINVHNSTQQGITSRFNVGQSDLRASDLVGRGLAENNAAAGRNQTAIDSSSRNALATYGIGMDLVGAYGAVGQNEYNRALGQGQLTNQIGQTSIQSNYNNAALRNEGVKFGAQESAFVDAQKALQKDDKGLLGLGFLGL